LAHDLNKVTSVLTPGTITQTNANLKNPMMWLHNIKTVHCQTTIWNDSLVLCYHQPVHAGWLFT